MAAVKPKKLLRPLQPTLIKASRGGAASATGGRLGELSDIDEPINIETGSVPVYSKPNQNYIVDYLPINYLSGVSSNAMSASQYSVLAFDDVNNEYGPVEPVCDVFYEYDNYNATNLNKDVITDLNCNLALSQVSNHFNVSGNVITYTGTKSRPFKIDWHVSGLSDAGEDRNCSLMIYHNNSYFISGQILLTLNTNNFQSGSMTTKVELQSGNTLNLKIVNIENNDDLIIVNQTLSISGL